jgi:hypothetical protein
MATGTGSTKNAWVQLYEARRVPSDQEVRAPGRPPGTVPRRKVGLTLSHGEIAEIDVWQQRFSELLHRSVSLVKLWVFSPAFVPPATIAISARIKSLNNWPSWSNGW